MRAVIQRINGAEITINGGETRKVGEGLVVFICAMEGDTDAQADFLVQKVCGLRVFKDENDPRVRRQRQMCIRDRVCTGEFGAHMHVSVENDGPVNIIIDTERIGK